MGIVSDKMKQIRRQAAAMEAARETAPAQAGPAQGRAG